MFSSGWLRIGVTSALRSVRLGAPIAGFGMVAGKPQTRCAGPISGAPSEQPDHLGVSFLLLPLHTISMKTAAPFPLDRTCRCGEHQNGLLFHLRTRSTPRRPLQSAGSDHGDEFCFRAGSAGWPRRSARVTALRFGSIRRPRSYRIASP